MRLGCLPVTSRAGGHRPALPGEAHHARTAGGWLQKSGYAATGASVPRVLLILVFIYLFIIYKVKSINQAELGEWKKGK